MKDKIIAFLHWVFGYERYLFIFACYKILSFRLLDHEKEFKAFLKLIEPNGHILDIGANIGVMSVLLSKKTSKDRQILAFEPIPSNYRVFEKVIRFFGADNVKLIKTALGNESGQIKMIIPVRDNAKKHGLSHVVDEKESDESGIIHDIEVNKLDELIESENNLKVEAIKIDVENFEFEVLSGGIEMIKRTRPKIFCELWKDEKRQKVMTLLQELGYGIFVFDKTEIEEFRAEEHTEITNFIFLPQT